MDFPHDASQYQTLALIGKGAASEVYQAHCLANDRDLAIKIIDLDETKDYIVLFTPKNRFGDTQPQLIYERNMSFNTLKEIGYVEIQYDGFKR